MELTKTLIYGEIALFLVIEFGILVLLLLVESIEVVFSLVIIVISIIYGAVVYFVSKPQGGGDVWEIIGSSNRRRIGVGIVFFVGVTILAYVFPFRPLNILAIFITLDVLLSLLPGKVVFYGRGLWEWSKFVYGLTLLVGLGFLFINLFSPSAESLIYGTSTLVMFVFVALVAVFIIIVFLGLAGHNIQGLRRS